MTRVRPPMDHPWKARANTAWEYAERKRQVKLRKRLEAIAERARALRTEEAANADNRDV